MNHEERRITSPCGHTFTAIVPFWARRNPEVYFRQAELVFCPSCSLDEITERRRMVAASREALRRN